MSTLNIEELALAAMAKNEEANVSWEKFTTQLEEKREEFTVEIQQMERLDAEAKSEALTFYVRK